MPFVPRATMMVPCRITDDAEEEKKQDVMESPRSVVKPPERKKRYHRNNQSNSYKTLISVYHPELLFCGECRTGEAAPVCLREGYDTECDQTSSVDPAQPLDQQKSTNGVRSAFQVQGICCASEVPAVRRLAKQLLGVSTVNVNIAAKRVYVHHAAGVGANEIAAHWTENGFAAVVVEDGERRAVGPSLRLVTSFSVPVMLLEEDIAAVEASLDGENADIQAIAIDDTGRLVIEHSNCVSASTIKQRIDRLTNFGPVEIESSSVGHRSSYCESTLSATNLTKSHVILLSELVCEGLRALHAHPVSHTIKAEHDPTLMTADDVCQLLLDLGLDATILIDGQAQNLYLPEELDASPSSNDDDDGPSHHRLRWNVALPGLFWGTSMLGAIFEAFHWAGAEFLLCTGLLSVVFGLPPVAIKAWRTLRRRDFDANCMMVIAALGAVALQEFDEAASVSFLFAVSEYLESKATSRAREALSSIVKLRPDHANLIDPVTKEIVVVAAEQVAVGSLISVRTGDKIAADGVVVEGTSSVDESSLTGESTPVRKRVDSNVVGGSINIGATQLIVRTTSSVEDSAVSRLIRLVEEAQANRSPTEKMIDGFARAYTPFVVGLAALMATVPWAFGREVGHYWTLNALIIIVISCPCALTISTPVTYAAGLAATAQKGIVVKGGANLEALGSVDKIVMDKTGTLTEGNFSVTHLEQVGDSRTRREMFSLLALMEAPSSHPLSATLVKAAKREGVSPPTNVNLKEHTILKGEGVEAMVDGKKTFAGNERLFERVNMFDNLQQIHKDHAREWSSKGGTVGFLGVEGEGIIGAFCVMDNVRPEAKEVVETLLFDGFQVDMLTGDSEGAALAVGKQVGLAESAIHSQLLPEDKLHFIGSLKRPAPKHAFGLCRRQPKVLFIGDGVNDAPGLAIADVGVSMGEGAALAMEMSDVTLMDSNLSKLLYLLQMGSKVMHTVQENIILSLVCKVAVVGLTFAGYMTLLYAIASDVGVMLLVTLNGMKLLPGRGDVVRSHSRRQSGKKYDGLPLAGSRNPTRVAEIV